MIMAKTEYRHSPWDLAQMQSLPLAQKIAMTQYRIREWYSAFEGNVYVAFSGGKDSTVLRHIVNHTPGVYNVPCVFVNTGLEYPEIQKFVSSFGDVTILYPEVSFVDVITKYGYPIISKDVASAVEDARRNVPLGKETARVKKLRGIYTGSGRRDGRKSKYNYSKWGFLYDAPFKISAKCCDIMKKKPFAAYERITGRKPFIGTLAAESAQRACTWRKSGCNAFDAVHPSSKPLSFWTEQDILQYLVDFDVPYAPIYGSIEKDDDGKFYTTGLDRTGCMFCGFGAHLEKKPNRFQRMQKTHPKQYQFCMNTLRMKNVLDYIGLPYENKCEEE